MFQNKDIINELNTLAPSLLELKTNVFTVPEHYFKHFGEAVLSEVKLLQMRPLISESRTKMDVPAGYFENLADNILARVKQTENLSWEEEIKQLSPALLATGNDNIYKVPSGYFDNLASNVINKVKTPGILVTMKPRVRFMRYAAAAVITALLGLSLFGLFNNKEAESTGSFLTASVITEANHIVESNSFEKVLESIPEQEIESYLKSGGQDVEAAIVASSIDTKELPSVYDYITDENTLDTFLDELNIKSYSN